MMTGINLYSIDYYKKTVFKGSYKGLCFRVAKAEVPSSPSGDAGEQLLSDNDAGRPLPEDGGALDGGEEALVPVLRVQAWKGPYILEKTDEEVFTEDFSYSDEGLAEANEWLERKQKELKK